MYRYFYDYLSVITGLLPRSLRMQHAIIVIRHMIMPLDHSIMDLSELHIRLRYSCATSSQIIYLEKILNDKFNPLSIYSPITITDNLAADEPAYMGNADEEQAAVYLGNAWASGVNYGEGDEVTHAGKVWQSLSDDNESNEPSADSEYWQSPTDPQETMQYMGHANEYTGGLYFIVNISSANHDAIEEAAMSAILNKYKIFGVTYTYNIYEEV